MAKFDWEKAKKKPGGTVQVATLGQTEKIEGDIKNMPLKSSKPSSEPAQTVNAEEYKKDMQRHAKKRAYQKQYRANKKAKAIKRKENQKDRRRSFESGKRQERERIIQLLNNYSFNEKHGGIIVNKDGEVACGVDDKVLSHKGDATWNDFQRVSTLVMANLIKEEQQ